MPPTWRGGKDQVWTGYVGVPGIIASWLIVVVLAAVLVYTLIAFWPAEPAAGQTSSTFFTWSLSATRETRLFVIASVTGALGGIIHSLRSLYGYVGGGKLKRSWMLMYFSLPVVGGLLALLFYIVLRGGLLTTQGSSSVVNPYGFAAVAVLVGLFSEQAVEKLKGVFEALFTKVEPGDDPIARKPAPDRQPPT